MVTFSQLILAVIGGGVLGELIRHLLIRYAFKQEQQAQINAEIARKRIEAVEHIRLNCLKMDIYEVMEFTHAEEFPEELNIGESTIYPSVLYNVEDWMAYKDEYSDIKSEYGHWCDCEIGAWLLHFEQYMFALTHFMISKNLSDRTHVVGAMFIADIQKWQREFDEVLVKRLNGKSMKSESHYGKRWEDEKKKRNKQWLESVLYKVINDADDELTLMVKEVLEIE